MDDLSCPQGFTCDPVECRRAFRCGALPILDHSGGNERDAALFGIVLVAICVGLFGLAMTVLFALGALGMGKRPATVWEVAAFWAGLTLVITLLAVGWMWLRRSYLRSRIRTLARAARLLGLEFRLRHSNDEAKRVRYLPLIHPGTQRNVEVLMAGTLDGLVVEVWEYTFTAGGSQLVPMLKPVRYAGFALGQDMNENTAASYMQYVVVAEQRQPRLPDFVCASQNSLLRPALASRYVATQVDLGGSLDADQFARKYRVFSSDTDATRRLFSVDLQRQLLELKTCNLQCENGRLLAFTHIWAAADFSAFPRKSEKLADEISRIGSILKALAQSV